MHRAAGVVLDGQEVALAALLARLGVAWLERRDGAAPPAALRLRDQLAAFARETTAVLVGGERENGKPAAAAIVAGCGPHEMTVQAAAGLLQISPQAVRGLCRSGDLLAVKAADGRWRIDAAAAAAMAARRRKGEVTP